MVSWDDVYKIHGVIQKNPLDSVKALVELFKKEKVEKILDHCCGTGRHAKYLAESGFCVFGTDSSSSGIEIAKQLCKTLPVEFEICDMGEIPYSDGFFDACIAVGSIHQGNTGQRENAFREITRVLKPLGLLFLEVMSIEHEFYRKGKPVPDDPGSFSPGSNSLPGEVRHYFSEEEIRSKLHGFDILSLEKITKYYRPGGFFPNTFKGYDILARKVEKG